MVGKKTLPKSQVLVIIHARQSPGKVVRIRGRPVDHWDWLALEQCIGGLPLVQGSSLASAAVCLGNGNARRHQQEKQGSGVKHDAAPNIVLCGTVIGNEEGCGGEMVAAYRNKTERARCWKCGSQKPRAGELQLDIEGSDTRKPTDVRGAGWEARRFRRAIASGSIAGWTIARSSGSGNARVPRTAGRMQRPRTVPFDPGRDRR